LLLLLTGSPLVTDPKVVKTRLQLQGELQRYVAKNQRTYRGVWHAFKTIITTEGPLALQKGVQQPTHQATKRFLDLFDGFFSLS